MKRRDFVSAGAPAWKAGVVRETSGKGAFIVVNGNAAFYNWSDIRPVQREELPKPSTMKAPLTAIAGVTNLKDFTKHEPIFARGTGDDDDLVIPYPDARVGQSLTFGGVADDPINTVDGSPGRRVGTAPRLQKPHRVTRCGEVFRRVRLSKCLQQEAVAQILGSNNRVVSCIELGDKLPSDNELLRFAEWSGYDLGDLELKRDADQRQFWKQTPAEPKEEKPPVHQNDLRPRPPFQPPAPPTPALAGPVDFIDFLHSLKSLVPCPQQAEQRSLWMTAAEQLWELHSKA